jgi:hypothetical protein
MQIPAGKIDIPIHKITNYRLARKAKNDKSQFLEQLGYNIETLE